MNYTEKLQNVSVLGAAGKMGSGILLLTAMEMADLSLMPQNKGKNFILNAVDVSNEALSGLMNFLKVQIVKAAEKKTVQLRTVYADRKDLIENGEIIDRYVFDVMSLIRPTTSLEPAYSSTLIFEAIKEDPDLKIKIFLDLKSNNKLSPWFFSNTSSIPINKLDQEAELEGCILGFHFYNPPAVQKLVELIYTEKTRPELIKFAREFAKKLRKKVVKSNDFAGFIGNGHFMRDALHGISETLKLSDELGFSQALYMINRVSQDFLIRPMGIFQLIDYVGIDVCQYIMSVMNPFLKHENLHSPLLDQLIDQEIRGGQFPNGTQKDGFLKYEKGKPVAVYNPQKKSYQAIEDFKAPIDLKLGSLPASWMPWRAVVGNPDKTSVLKNYFSDLKEADTRGAKLALTYGKKSKEISRQLVNDGIADCDEDVNTVLLTGFYHSYGPINEYFD
jgi:3-hydroxyacyl-CoA dehydrogenase